MSPIACLLFVASLIASIRADCSDSDGTTHTSGEEWTKHGSMTGMYEFVLRCSGLRTEVVACVVPGSGEHLSAGQTTTFDNREWRCVTGNGNTLMLHMRPTMFMQGSNIQEATPTTHSESVPSAMKPASGESPVRTTFNRGQAGGTSHCTDSNGQSHQSRDEWFQRGSMTHKYDFVMRCVENQQADAGTGGWRWRVEMVGCVVPTTGERLAIGQTTTTTGDNRQWTCGGSDGIGTGMGTMNMQSLLGGPSTSAMSKKGEAEPMTGGGFQ